MVLEGAGSWPSWVGSTYHNFPSNPVTATNYLAGVAVPVDKLFACELDFPFAFFASCASATVFPAMPPPFQMQKAFVCPQQGFLSEKQFSQQVAPGP